MKQSIADATDVDTGILDAVSQLHAAFPHSSLNSIILAPHRLVAVHVNAAATAPTDDIRTRFPVEGEAPLGHLDRYFTMSVSTGADRVQVVSSGIRGPGWVPLAENTVLFVDTDTLEQRVMTVPSMASGKPAGQR